MSNFLEFHNVSKAFASVKALNEVSFEISEGEIHGLMGENGAGKSTLVKILSGVYTPDSGYIAIAGETKDLISPAKAKKEGISVIQQELQLSSHLTVAENIMLGEYASKNGFINWRDLFKRARDFLSANKIAIDEKVKVSSLTIGQQQMVEIAKALFAKAKIIAFDEPTSSLSKVESDLLFDIILQLKAQGKVIIYISHRMNEVFELCDTCTILRDGNRVITYSSDNKVEMTRDNIIKNMTGKKLSVFFDYKSRELGDVMLETKDLKGNKINKPANIKVQKGEVVGIFGLIGAGRSELARLIFGADRKEYGDIYIQGDSIKNNIYASMQAGIAFCSEDRKSDGIISGRPIWENINVCCRNIFNRFKVLINFNNEYQNAGVQIEKLSIKTPSVHQNINNLSGGNQQKVLLARWISKDGLKLLIIDEPTRGIDVGAKHEIYKILYKLAENGLGILMISSELPEIMGVCDRIYIMRDGYISGEFDRAEFDETTILENAFPVEENVHAND